MGLQLAVGLSLTGLERPGGPRRSPAPLGILPSPRRVVWTMLRSARPAGSSLKPRRRGGESYTWFAPS